MDGGYIMKGKDGKIPRPGLFSFAGVNKSNTLTSVVTDSSGVAVTTIAHTQSGAGGSVNLVQWTEVIL